MQNIRMNQAVNQWRYRVDVFLYRMLCLAVTGFSSNTEQVLEFQYRFCNVASLYSMIEQADIKTFLSIYNKLKDQLLDPSLIYV